MAAGELEAFEGTVPEFNSFSRTAVPELPSGQRSDSTLFVFRGRSVSSLVRTGENADPSPVRADSKARTMFERIWNNL